MPKKSLKRGQRQRLVIEVWGPQELDARKRFLKKVEGALRRQKAKIVRPKKRKPR